jgi:hypothetical protein
MTTETSIEQIMDDTLTRIVKIDRAIDRALLPVADSIEVHGGRKGVEAEIKRLKDSLKGMLEDSTEQAYYAREVDVEAKLQNRQGTPTLDLITMAKDRPEILAELAVMGCLKVDWATFKTNWGKSAAVDDAKRYEMPGKGTVALLIGPPK